MELEILICLKLRLICRVSLKRSWQMYESGKACRGYSFLRLCVCVCARVFLNVCIHGAEGLKGLNPSLATDEEGRPISPRGVFIMASHLHVSMSLLRELAFSFLRLPPSPVHLGESASIQYTHL